MLACRRVHAPNQHKLASIRPRPLAKTPSDAGYQYPRRHTVSTINAKLPVHRYWCTRVSGLISGRTSSDRDAASHAMWPGNAKQSSTHCGAQSYAHRQCSDTYQRLSRLCTCADNAFTHGNPRARKLQQASIYSMGTKIARVLCPETDPEIGRFCPQDRSRTSSPIHLERCSWRQRAQPRHSPSPSPALMKTHQASLSVYPMLLRRRERWDGKL